MLTVQDQIKELIKTSHNILVTFKEKYTLDALGSSLALAQILKKMGKKVTVTAHDLVIPPHFEFLPVTEHIQKEFQAHKKIVISLDLSKTPIKDLSYQITDNQLKIFLTPKNPPTGPLEPKADLAPDFPYDLIFVLDTEDLESLGDLYNKNADFFYHTPLINIDHHSHNLRFGQINFIEVTATSTAEMLYHFFKSWSPEHFDEDVATCLLSGMIGKTNCFKSPSITPKALIAASELIGLGARREQVITCLYQNKTLPQLQLWGQALARLKSDGNGRLVWTSIALDDFKKFNASPESLLGIVDELIVNMPAAKIILLFSEHAPGVIEARCHSTTAVSALDILKPFQPTGDAALATARFTNATLKEVEEKVLAEAKRQAGTNGKGENGTAKTNVI